MSLMRAPAVGDRRQVSRIASSSPKQGAYYLVCHAIWCFAIKFDRWFLRNQMTSFTVVCVFPSLHWGSAGTTKSSQRSCFHTF
eukprot:jgi/Botrbrau1/21293/Bobra.0184s0006.1